jgi:hypothetical protein
MTADKAFVSSADYNGVQFVKRLRSLPDPALQQAEIAIYFRNFDEAERIYKSIQVCTSVSDAPPHALICERAAR